MSYLIPGENKQWNVNVAMDCVSVPLLFETLPNIFSFADRMKQNIKFKFLTYNMEEECSVSDLYSLNPDPAKNLNPDPEDFWIRIQAERTTAWKKYKIIL